MLFPHDVVKCNEDIKLQMAKTGGKNKQLRRNIFSNSSHSSKKNRYDHPANWNEIILWSFIT